LDETEVKLTVFFEEPFWVGVFERREGGRNSSVPKNSVSLHRSRKNEKKNTGADKAPVF